MFLAYSNPLLTTDAALVKGRGGHSFSVRLTLNRRGARPELPGECPSMLESPVASCHFRYVATETWLACPAHVAQWIEHGSMNGEVPV